MTVYIDSEYQCHVTNPDGVFREVETGFFDGKCDAYIEGYRFVPSGEAWTRGDGTVFPGEMIAPWRPWEELDSIQREYRLAQLEEGKRLLEEQAQAGSEDAALLLETAADHEYRLCLMELGVSEDDL